MPRAYRNVDTFTAQLVRLTAESFFFFLWVLWTFVNAVRYEIAIGISLRLSTSTCTGLHLGGIVRTFVW